MGGWADGWATEFAVLLVWAVGVRVAAECCAV